MAARKSSTTKTSSKRAPAKKPVIAPTAAQPREFSLHIGTGFSLLTERLGDGVMVAGHVPAGAILEVSYWKEPAPKTGALTGITFHARLDGVPVPPAIIAVRDGANRLVRAPARLELPVTCRQLEYWFELQTDTKEALWDSNWGHNHWLELATDGTNGAEPKSTTRAEA